MLHIIPTQVTNTVNYPHSENVNSEAYERVWYGEKTLQLIRGVMQPYEQISGYERVHYNETMEQMWRTMFGEESVEPYEQISGYERVQYSAKAMRLLKRMPHVATYADTDQNCGYERVQYCEEAVQLLRRMPHVATCADTDQTSGYDRVLYREQRMRYPLTSRKNRTVKKNILFFWSCNHFKRRCTHIRLKKHA